MSNLRKGRLYGESVAPSRRADLSPGKRTLTEGIQLKTTPATATAVSHDEPQAVAGDSGPSSELPGAQRIAARGMTGPAQQLPHADHIQALFGRHSVAGIEAHIGGPAADASRELGAQGFAMGNAVAFGGTPDLHTAAHEAAHVVQQRAGVHLAGGIGQPGDPHEQHADAVADLVVQGKSAESLLDQYRGGGGGDGRDPVQCSLSGNRPIPGATSRFEWDLQTRDGRDDDPPTKSGLEGFIRFIPGPGAPNSNLIAITQIIKTTNPAPTAPDPDLDIGTLPKDRRARGALGQLGIRTQDDPSRGIEGGFSTDIAHQQDPNHPALPAGSPTLPRFGTGSEVPQNPGFKRSDLPEDIRSVTLRDFPGARGRGVGVDFEFQSVARGEDQGIDYGTVRWGFGLRDGAVTNEHLDLLPGATATFHEALDRHYDFYVHEPVTLYFGFNSDGVDPAEDAKLAAVLPYLTRNGGVRMSLEGFADRRGNPSYNLALAMRRAEAVRASLVGHGVAATRINGPSVSHGASTEATKNAGTGNQEGDAKHGADQDREANRQFNRRVVVTFIAPPSGAKSGATSGPVAEGPAPKDPIGG